VRNCANVLLLLCLGAITGASAALSAPVSVRFGPDIWKLQDLVDRRYGKDQINVTRDFIGATGGDIDPWFWVGNAGGAVRVRMVKCNADRDILGWYEESGGPRLPDGGGVLYSGVVGPEEETVVPLPGFRIRFGFYVDATTGGTKRFFTNRRFNDCGLDGTGAIHAPFDGDIQALMFDVSRWTEPNTWLVCFDDQDTGGAVAYGGGSDGRRRTEAKCRRFREESDSPAGGTRWSDNEFCDVVFEVRAEGATPARSVSFGGLKLLYR
jgi:hypothetical protein